MNNKGLVYFHEEIAGEIFETSEGEFVFQYAETYLSKKSSPISYSLPLQVSPYFSNSLHGFFDGLIPEGWILKLATEHWKLNPYRDRFQLLLKTAFDPIGAVNIISSSEKKKKLYDDPPQVNQENKNIAYGKCLYCYEDLSHGIYHEKCSLKIFQDKSPPLIELTHEVLQELEKISIKKHLTIPGMQRKLSLELEKNKKDSRLILTNYAGRFILKPQGHIPHIPENEDLIMKLAKDYGIKTAETAMLPLANGELSLLSKRLDRSKYKEKFHMEDFCQILDVLTLKKYVGSSEKVAKTLRKYTYQNAPEEQVLRFFELTLFSYIVGNSDLHLKNISVIQDPLPRLAPAYDLLSFEIFQEDFPERDNEEMALAINGKKNKLTRHDFDQLANSLAIKEKVRNYIYKRFVQQEESWGKWIDKSFLKQNKKTLLKELICLRLKIFDESFQEE